MPPAASRPPEAAEKVESNSIGQQDEAAERYTCCAMVDQTDDDTTSELKASGSQDQLLARSWSAPVGGRPGKQAVVGAHKQRAATSTTPNNATVTKSNGDNNNIGSSNNNYDTPMASRKALLARYKSLNLTRVVAKGGEHNKWADSLRPTSSSSAASDSAFSQSQATLEADDSDTTLNRFASTTSTTTKSSSNKMLHDADQDHDHLSSASSGSCDTTGGHTACSEHGNHFKIVWQNLTYEIPEKCLFSRLNSIAHKVKSSWTSLTESQATKTAKPPAMTVNNNHKLSIHLEDGLTAPGHHQHHDFHRNTSDDDNNNKHRHRHHRHHHHHHHHSRHHHRRQMSHEHEMAPEPAAASRQRHTIFSNLNGCVESGQLTAILGPSGAGKTTFLKCLTNGLTKGVSGSITIHSKQRASNASGDCGLAPYKSTSQHLKLCIIPQKDYLFDNLTVMENLLFASRIKNTQPDQKFDHKENVFRIASLLGLENCLRLKTDRLSGGQYKRVSIAQELLSQPDILILDEPTSGLDSLTCFRTVSVLRDLADMSQAGLLAPLAIIMTIHQPQIKIFNLFHHVYVLSSSGQCVYEGRPEFLVDTVADQCKLLPPPDDQNPASFIIDLASEVYGQQPIEQLMDLHQSNFAALDANVGCVLAGSGGAPPARDSPPVVVGASKAPPPSATAGNRNNNNNHNHNHNHNHNQLIVSEQLTKRYNHQHSFWLHIGLLIRRLWISAWRDSLLTTTRITFHILIPFVFYFVYSQKSGLANACPHVERELDIKDMVSDSNIERLTIQHDELILTFENVSLFFLLLYSFSMCVLAVTALSFPLNMQILLKETNNGWYTMPRFVMAKTLADLPMELAMPMVSVSIAYSLTGQPSSYMHWRLLAVTAIMTVCSLISQTQGLLFGAYFMNNVQAAVFISQASTLPWIMLSGFTTRVSQLPKVLQWLSFGSIYRLGIESIVAVRYGYGMCPCNETIVNNTPAKIVGIPDQVRSLMSYYLDMYSDMTGSSSASDNFETSAAQDVAAGRTASSAAVLGSSSSVKSVFVSASNSTTANDASIGNTSANNDIFSRIASTLVRANTYGANIVTCRDVRPFIMSAREVDESTLPWFMSILVLVLLSLRILLFFVVRIRTG